MPSHRLPAARSLHGRQCRESRPQPAAPAPVGRATDQVPIVSGIHHHHHPHPEQAMDLLSCLPALTDPECCRAHGNNNNNNSNNMMFATAGHLITTVTGLDLGAFFRRHLWLPMGMRSTFLGPYDPHLPGSGLALAEGYWWVPGDERDDDEGEDDDRNNGTEAGSYVRSATPRVRVDEGAGGVLSNVLDYARYLRAMMAEAGPVSRAGHRELKRPRTFHDMHADLVGRLGNHPPPPRLFGGGPSPRWLAATSPPPRVHSHFLLPSPTRGERGAQELTRRRRNTVRGPRDLQPRLDVRRPRERAGVLPHRHDQHLRDIHGHGAEPRVGRHADGQLRHQGTRACHVPGAVRPARRRGGEAGRL